MKAVNKLVVLVEDWKIGRTGKETEVYVVQDYDTRRVYPVAYTSEQTAIDKMHRLEEDELKAAWPEILAPLTLRLGHTDFGTAYVVEDYPYGRQLRTQKKMWVETRSGYGQRGVYATLNPKTKQWNKPKHGTYFTNTYFYYFHLLHGWSGYAQFISCGLCDQLSLAEWSKLERDKTYMSRRFNRVEWIG